MAGTLGEGMDANLVTRDLVTGLRAALRQDPAVPGPAFVARLVREEGLRYTGADLADDSTTAADLFVSAPTAGVLLSAGLLATVAGPSAQAHGLLAPNPHGSTVETLSPTRKCNPQLTLDWVVWFLAKVAGGVEVPGMHPWEGVFRELIEHLTSGHHGETPPGASDKVTVPEQATKVAGIVATFLTFVELLVAVLSVQADAVLEEGEPLVRTTSDLHDGELKTILVTVSFNPYADPNDVGALNCLLIMALALGSTARLPAPGEIPEAAVTLVGGLGFGERLNEKGSYVLLPGYVRRKIADHHGLVRWPVSGRRLKRSVPEDAPEFKRTFSVFLKSTLEEGGANTISKTLFNSFLCGGAILAGNPIACREALTDLIKQLDWDLGEVSFRLIDHAPKVRFVFKGNHTWRQLPPSNNDLWHTSGTITFTGTMSCVQPPDTLAGEWICDGSLTLTGNGKLTAYHQGVSLQRRCTQAWAVRKLRIKFLGGSPDSALSIVALARDPRQRLPHDYKCGSYYDATPSLPLSTKIVGDAIPLPGPDEASTVPLAALDPQSHVQNGTVTVTITSIR